MYEEDTQEYSRLNQELIERLKICYGDGAMLASFLLVYYATVIAGLIQCVAIESSFVSFLLFGSVSAVAYFFPVVILRCFAEKYKESYLGLCNVALFCSVYHEKPILSEGSLRGKKWELLHFNTLNFTYKGENKEYFFLGMASLSLLLISFIVSICLFLAIEKLTLLVKMFGAAIAVLYLCLILLAARVVLQIHRATNMKRLKEEYVDLICMFYERQKAFLTDGDYKEDELSVRLSELKQKQNEIEKEVSEHKLSCQDIRQIITDKLK